jgi:N-acetylglucosamine transport system permease protein
VRAQRASRMPGRKGPGFHASRVVLVIWSLMILLPLFWLLYSSLKDNKAFYANPWALPAVLHWENYYNAWVQSNVSRYFLNSLVVVVVPLVFSMLMSSMMAYTIAKFQLKLKGELLLLITVPLFIPGMIFMVPQFFLAARLHLTNSLWGLMVFYSLGNVPFSALQLVAFFRSLPDSLPEAARLDGCNEFGIFYKVIMPLTKPGLSIVAILTIMGLWNEYGLALIFLADERKYTVPIGIAQLAAQQQYRTDFGALFAGLVLAMVPILVIYCLFQRSLLDGTAHAGAVKG